MDKNTIISFLVVFCCLTGPAVQAGCDVHLVAYSCGPFDLLICYRTEISCSFKRSVSNQNMLDVQPGNVFATFAFNDLDHDNNGFVDLPDWTQHGGSHEGFTAVDLNGDGKLSSAEFDEVPIEIVEGQA